MADRSSLEQELQDSRLLVSKLWDTLSYTDSDMVDVVIYQLLSEERRAKVLRSRLERSGE